MKYVTYDQLPLMLNAEDVQHVMNISRAGAYQLMHREDFPTILVGKRMVVPRDKFLEWVEKNTGPGPNGCCATGSLAVQRQAMGFRLY